MFIRTILTTTALVSTSALAQPALVDTPWHEKSHGRWERHLGGIGGQATLIIDRTGTKPVFKVIRPCFFHPDQHYTISWQAGARVGTGTDCLGHRGYREDIRPWLPLFAEAQP